MFLFKNILLYLILIPIKKEILGLNIPSMCFIIMSNSDFARYQCATNSEFPHYQNAQDLFFYPGTERATSIQTHIKRPGYSYSPGGAYCVSVT